MSDPTVRSRLVEVREAVEALLGENGATLQNVVEATNDVVAEGQNIHNRAEEILSLLRLALIPEPIDAEYPTAATRAEINVLLLRAARNLLTDILLQQQQSQAELLAIRLANEALLEGLGVTNGRISFVAGKLTELNTTVSTLQPLVEIAGAIRDGVLGAEENTAVIAGRTQAIIFQLEELKECVCDGEGPTLPTQPACLSGAGIGHDAQTDLGVINFGIRGNLQVWALRWGVDVFTSDWITEVNSQGRWHARPSTSGISEISFGSAPELNGTPYRVFWSTTAIFDSGSVESRFAPVNQRGWQELATQLPDGNCFTTTYFSVNTGQNWNTTDEPAEVLIVAAPGAPAPPLKSVFIFPQPQGS